MGSHSSLNEALVIPNIQGFFLGGVISPIFKMIYAPKIPNDILGNNKQIKVPVLYIKYEL